jgi:hypothetical protein
MINFDSSHARSLPVFVLLLFRPGCPARLMGIPKIADLTEKGHLIVGRRSDQGRYGRQRYVAT